MADAQSLLEQLGRTEAAWENFKGIMGCPANIEADRDFHIKDRGE